jgi:putative peptide zinc metalloprotease protein
MPTTADERQTEPARRAADGELPPGPAEGIELVGEYEDSGYREPPYLVRRADGQTIQLSRLLYLVVQHANGRRDHGEVADRVSRAFGRPVSAHNVRTLVEKKLRPLGVLAQADGASPELEKPDPLLALSFRAAVVPARVTRALTTIFYPLFFPPVVAAVLAGLLAVDVWFFFFHGVAQSTRQLLYNPVLLLLVLGLVVVATALHELGHATAARYGGAEPGVMGAGIYVVWPAFYTDVTDAYRLNRIGRLRTDLGGIYFNAIFVLGIAGAYALTGFEPLLVLIVIQHLQIVQQLLPFLRLDGYYVLSDLTGVPDLFARLRPTLKSALPGREADEKVKELKPWVRMVTTGWVLALIPVLLFVFGLLAFNAPRMFATAYDSLGVQADRIGEALEAGSVLSGLVGVIQATTLVLPLAGMTYSFGRVLGRVLRGAWSWSEEAPGRRALVLAASTALAGAAAFVLLPNGDYRPIERGERGTLRGSLTQFRNVPTGRPAVPELRGRTSRPTEKAEPRGTGGPEAPRSRTETRDARTTTVPETSRATTTNSADAPAGETTAEPDGQPGSTDSTPTEPAATTETVTTETPTTETTAP